jgi:hypothetical protein
MGLFDNFYGGFNPNVIQTQTVPQMRMTPNPPSITPIQAPQPVELPRVNGYDGALRFPLGPNSRIALFDGNEDIMYIKQTDAGGYPTVTRYRFTPEEQTTSDGQQYVTLDEFNKFKEEMLNGQQFIRESAEPIKPSSSNRNGQSKRNGADV